MSNRKLGKTQISWLKCCIRDGASGVWFPGCGHYWKNRSTSINLCESLVRRGLMEKIDDRPTYRVTKAGRESVENLRKGQP